jgi:dienelactone hydrolase
VRAQLFAEAIASCGSSLTLTPPRAKARRVAPAPAPRPPPAPEVKVPGIEASGISFTEPMSVAGRDGELLLPGTRPPYPAIAMVHGAGRATRETYRPQAEYLARRGIAVLIYDKRPATGYQRLAADARAAVAALRARKDIRAAGIGLWGFGEGAQVAAMAAAGNPDVAAVVAVSPGLASGANQAWAARHAVGGTGSAAVTRWYEVTSHTGDGGRDPGAAWRQVAQPVLAVWGTRDLYIPVHAGAVALRDALAAGRGRDRTFRTFPGASHAIAVSYSNGAAVLDPRYQREMAAWLGSHLTGRARPLVDTPLPKGVDDPKPVDVTRASFLTAPPIQLGWVAVPLLLFALALRAPRARRLTVAALALGVAGLAAIAAGVAAAQDGTGVAHVLGVPLLFALAFAFTAATVVVTALLLRRRLLTAALAATLLIGLELFWLL